jgi:hypothetical protein
VLPGKNIKVQRMCIALKVVIILRTVHALFLTALPFYNTPSAQSAAHGVNRRGVTSVQYSIYKMLLSHGGQVLPSFL